MKTERVLGIVFLISIIGRFLNLFPGFSSLLLVSGLALGLLYFPMAFYFFSDKELKKQNLILSIVGGLAFSIACYGIVFKMMFWPGASIENLGSIIFLAGIMVVFFVVSGKAKPELNTYYKNYKTRLLFWMGMAVLFLFIDAKTIVLIENRNHPEIRDVRLRILEYNHKSQNAYGLSNLYHARDSLYQAAEGFTNYVRDN
jgi:hypothetical protein